MYDRPLRGDEACGWDGREMGENEVWCQAWRLLVKHKQEVDSVIAAKIRQCEESRDADGADYWRRVLAALDDFR